MKNQKNYMPVGDCFSSTIELKQVEDKVLNKYGRIQKVFLQEYDFLKKIRHR